ncbi:isovaleryl-CoA dehydrogenase [Undibacterium sp. Rencai35W]|uniref:isovaleryl-CoA dehydrogenase n=1 Tax=Undibacterium sp. Rencai35W TaxID=3413046 RepID=UPI003BF21756
MSEKVKRMNEFDSYGAVTHEVSNQPQDLLDYNLFTTDIALQEAVTREGAAWATDELDRFGAESGRADYLALGQLANKYIPEFDTHDHHGHRVDVVRFHPAYHQLMQKAIGEGLHASPWLHPQAGAHVARAARFYMQSQVEAGHGCPVTMTFAAIPCLQAQPDLAAQWLPKIMSLEYDPRNIPAAQKKGLTIGMAMTEKQGGSDVRANTTRAIPVAAGSDADGGQAYELTGHKYFVSAPMSDAFLVLAQAPGGLSCFLLPRWRPDGSKNPLQIQRLKKKMGNVSNASSETELRGALAWMVGKEGRGVATIIEMVAMTRFDCMIGSSAGMRAALNQALHHCRQRKTFGTLLTDQPLMQNVLADLALESEAALALTMRMARAIDNRNQRTQPSEDLLLRLGTAIGKYWICKRTPQHAYEAMECIGGSGVMEETVMPRLYREAPVNAIWEGSGNVQCLDVLRAISKTPEVLPVFFAELDKAKTQHIVFDRYVEQLKMALRDTTDLEYRARDLVDRMALALQAAQLLMSAPVFVSDAFCRSRLDSQGHHQYGALPRHIDVKSIIERAMPE